MIYREKNIAFTLAEVLITLGIIGVIATLTIPSLVVNYQKTQTISKLKKVYSILSQAVKMSENVNGNNADWDWGNGSSPITERESFDIYWAPYLKIARYCTASIDCGYTSTAPWKYANGTGTSTNPVASGRTAVLLSDGTFIFVRDYTGKYILVDLNAGKEPNKSGVDLFEFVLDPQKGLVPYAYADTATYINNACITNNQLGCAAKLIRDGWEMKSDYPW